MKTRIASVLKFSIVASRMKTFIAAIIFSVIAISVRAQGFISLPGSQNFGNQATESYMIIAPTIPTLSPSGSSTGIGAAFQTPSLTIQAVPEPSSFALLTLGIVACASVRRRFRVLGAGLN